MKTVSKSSRCCWKNRRLELRTSISGKGSNAVRPAQLRTKTSAAIPAFKNARPREYSVRGRSSFVSEDGMALGLAHAPDKFLGENATKILRTGPRQVAVIDPEFHVVKGRIFARVVKRDDR